MKTALEGVSNFRNFQAKAGDFFEYARTQFSEQKVRDQEKTRYQEALAKALDVREKKADKWWRRILTWVLIIGGLISIAEILGPAIRKTFHLPVAVNTQTSLNAPQSAGNTVWRK